MYYTDSIFFLDMVFVNGEQQVWEICKIKPPSVFLTMGSVLGEDSMLWDGWDWDILWVLLPLPFKRFFKCPLTSFLIIGSVLGEDSMVNCEYF